MTLAVVGSPAPLGATVLDGGVNFSLYSRTATGVELLFFDRGDDPRPARTVRLDPVKNRTYHYWHCFVAGAKAGQLYAYRVGGPNEPARGLRFDPAKVLLDPYGRAVVMPEGYSPEYARRPGDNAAAAMKSAVVDGSGYDWEGDKPLRTPSARTVIYEMHVKGFTAHPNSGVKEHIRGSYAGLAEKIPYLKDLGVTAVELLPVHDFDPHACPPGLVNYWGCGNTLNANHPVVRRMIVDSLRYWVTEMRVDGFRFDLASILSRDQHGRPLPNPPVLWDIESDPALAGTKLIAEAWDAAGLYQVGSFVGDAWKEWNGRFRDDARDFFRGEPGAVRRFADRLLGSPEVYGHKGREAEQSVNFVTCHDSEANWFDWSLPEKHADVHRFVKLLLARRVLRDVTHEQSRTSLTDLIGQANKGWHGVRLNQPDWGEGSRSIAFGGELKADNLFFHLILNGYWGPLDFELPATAAGRPWRRWIDTSLPSPQDIVEWTASPPVPGGTYRAGPRSVVMLHSGG